VETADGYRQKERAIGDDMIYQLMDPRMAGGWYVALRRLVSRILKKG